MKNKDQDTADILSAISDMMKEDGAVIDQQLPKDILDLTESVQEKKEDILELTELVSGDRPTLNTNETAIEKVASSIDESEIEEMVRDSIQEHTADRIDLIIKQEMKKIIKEKLDKTEIFINPEDVKQ